jgi:hypothetical protein
MNLAALLLALTLDDTVVPARRPCVLQAALHNTAGWLTDCEVDAPPGDDAGKVVTVVNVQPSTDELLTGALADAFRIGLSDALDIHSTEFYRRKRPDRFVELNRLGQSTGERIALKLAEIPATVGLLHLVRKGWKLGPLHDGPHPSRARWMSRGILTFFVLNSARHYWLALK